MRVTSVWCENWYSDVLLIADHACKKLLRTFVFSSRFLKKHVFYYIFYVFLNEISTVLVPGCLKIEKSMIFFEFLVLSLYCFLIVKSRVEHVFAGFRAIWRRKSTLFDDVPSKKTVFAFLVQPLFNVRVSSTPKKQRYCCIFGR